MKTIQFLIVALILMVSAPIAHAGGACGSAGEVWPADNDGSVRLTYQYREGGERLELIHRPEERIIVARGLVPEENGFRESHVVYDLDNGNIIHALGKVRLHAKKIKPGFPAEYAMQSQFDIKVYAADKGFDDGVKALLASNRDKGCQDEMMKLSQGREYDKEKCGETITAFNEVMGKLSRPETAGFTEITANAQAQKFVETVRSERSAFVFGIFTDRNDPDGKKKAFCTGIQKMALKLIGKLRDPDMQKKLAVKKKMPGYLDEPKGFEKTTVERYRY